MILERLEEVEHFTPQEQAVAKYILEHGELVQKMSTEELAKAAFTSKATVVRLCKKLQVESYQELKLQLVAETVQRIRINQLFLDEPVTSESSFQDIVETLPGLYDKAITETKLCINKNVMQRVINRMKTAEKTTLYGSGISYTLAQSAAFKFATLGMDTGASESVNAHYLAASKRKEVAIIISFTGANSNMISVAKYLKKTTSDYVVGIVGSHNEEIRQWCDELIEIPSRHTLLSLKVVTSFTAATYVLDILFSMMLSSTYESHVKSALKMVSKESLRVSVDYWNLQYPPENP